MTDWPLIAVRLALYGDLGLLFGIPLFALYAKPAVPPRRLALLYAALAAGGMAFSYVGFLLLAASMSGASLATLDHALAWTLFKQTAVGAALAARMTALLLALLIAILLPSRRSMTWSIMLLGGTALASLAWNGHAAADEGATRVVHLGADIVHLLAGSAWIGALAMLLALVAKREPVGAWRIDYAQSALRGFATIGSIFVALIALSGLANIILIFGPDGLTALPGSIYGRLLLAKLALFVAMLGCAALNRLVLTPRLVASGAAAFPALRRSIAVESLFALGVVALVAWFGTLAPI